MLKVIREIAAIQEKYANTELDENSAETKPYILFQKWLQEVIDSKLFIYPNAVTLSTASKRGLPSSRTVLLKDFNEDGFVFYTNYKSKKGSDKAHIF